MKKIAPKPLLLTALVVLVVIGAVVGVLAWRSDDTPDNEETTPVLINDDATSGGNATKNENADDQTSATTTNGNISLKISKTFTDDNGDFVVQTEINGASSGTCKLTLTKGSATISKSAGVLYQSSFSTCKGFTIPSGEIPSGGNWQLKLTLESENSTATVSQEVNIDK